MIKYRHFHVNFFASWCTGIIIDILSYILYNIRYLWVSLRRDYRICTWQTDLFHFLGENKWGQQKLPCEQLSHLETKLGNHNPIIMTGVIVYYCSHRVTIIMCYTSLVLHMSDVMELWIIVCWCYQAWGVVVSSRCVWGMVMWPHGVCDHTDRHRHIHTPWHTHKHTETQTHTHQDPLTHTYRDTDTHTPRPTHTHIQRHRHKHTKTHSHTHTEAQTQTDTHRHTYSHPYIHTLTHKQRHTDTLTNRHTCVTYIIWARHLYFL